MARMHPSIRKPWAVATLSAVAVVATFILYLEVSDPSPSYIWRVWAERALTASSAGFDGKLGLSSAKLSFRMRERLSTSETVHQLAISAAREEYSSLSSVAYVYLAQRSLANPFDDDYDAPLVYAKKAFEEEPNELTAWQYATLIRRGREEVPQEVASVLTDGGRWEYTTLLEIDTTADLVSKSVFSVIDNISDDELRSRLQFACQAEEDLVFWSDPENRRERAAELKQLRAKIEPLARMSRPWAFAGNFVEGFIQRVYDSLSGIISGRDPLGAQALLSKGGRRMLTALDALAALDGAGTQDQKIVEARKIWWRSSEEIISLESGEILNDIARTTSKRRGRLKERVDTLLSDPERYKVDESVVLEAIEGGNGNSQFLQRFASTGGHTWRGNSVYGQWWLKFDLSSCQ